MTAFGSRWSRKIKMWIRVSKVLAVIFLSIVSALSEARAGTVLITDQEAKLPPDTSIAGSRGITRGPRIEYVRHDGPVRSPLHFQMKLQSFGGSTIVLQSLRLIYLKTPDVDLTSRVMPFALASGIDIPDAEIPSGEHYLRADVTDSEGRTRTEVFVLKVAPRE
jgi:hypothetical protein